MAQCGSVSQVPEKNRRDLVGCMSKLLLILTKTGSMWHWVRFWPEESLNKRHFHLGGKKKKRKKKEYKHKDRNSSVVWRGHMFWPLQKEEQNSIIIECSGVFSVNVSLLEYGWFTTLHLHLQVLFWTVRATDWNFRGILRYRMATLWGKQNTTLQLKTVISKLSIYYQSKDHSMTIFQLCKAVLWKALVTLSELLELVCTSTYKPTSCITFAHLGNILLCKKITFKNTFLSMCWDLF